MDQALTTLRLAWRWRGRFLRPLALPLLALTALAIIDWHTSLIGDLQYFFGLRFFHDPHALAAQALVQGAVQTLYAAGPALAAAAILSAIIEQPAAARWLPGRGALPLVGALVVVALTDVAVSASARELMLRYLFSFGLDWVDSNRPAILQVLLVASCLDVFAPIAAIVAIIVARYAFAAAAARSARPSAERAANAALLVFVVNSAFILAHRVLVHRLPAEPEAMARPPEAAIITLATYLVLTAVMSALFATAVAVAAFGQRQPATIPAAAR